MADGAAAIPTSDERTMAVLAHALGIVAGFIPALVIMLTKGNDSTFVRAQAVEALNFQITLILAYLVSGISMILLIGFLLLPVVMIGSIVLMIMAAIAVNNGQDYRYPFALRLVK
jgi:uncharacterized protein